MQKRGQFEIQFNWIFVLAVGAIILLFFTVIMLKQKTASEQTTNIFVLKNLEAILAGAEVSTGTVNFVDLPKIEIEFECNKYRIGSATKSFEIISVFTPSKIKSNKMITWTLDWNVPYRVTNFLYLTSPNIRYVLVGDNDLARKINKSMPKELNKELIKISDINNIKNKNDDKIRFVFFNIDKDDSVISEFEKMHYKDVTALKISGGENTGSVEFFEKDKNTNTFTSKGTSYYLKEPSLIGAIFTDDVEMYNCVMKNAFKKLNIVTEVYKKKTEDLKNYYDTQGNIICKQTHESALSKIGNIRTLSEIFNQGNIFNINTDSIVLQDIDNKNAQLYSCALIY